MQSYKKAKRWDYGEVITPQKLNDMSDALQAFTEQIYNATFNIQDKYDSEGKPLNEKLNDRLDDLDSRIQFNSIDAIRDIVRDFTQEAVSYAEDQSGTLLPSQKETARINIGAAAQNEVVTYLDESGQDTTQQGVSVDQLPPSTKKANARKNIEAVWQTDFDNAIASMVKYEDQRQQPWMDTGKQQAVRENIGAVSNAEAETIADNKVAAATATINSRITTEVNTLNNKINNKIATSDAITNIDADVGTLTVTKGLGNNTTSSTIEISGSLAFDGGYCAIDDSTENGHMKLYLTKNGEKVSGLVYTPIDLSNLGSGSSGSGGGLAFDGGFCSLDKLPVIDEHGQPTGQEEQVWRLHLTSNSLELPEQVYTPIILQGSGGGGGSGNVGGAGFNLSDRSTFPGTGITKKDDAICSVKVRPRTQYVDVVGHWYVNGEWIRSADVSQSYDENGIVFEYNAKGKLKIGEINTIKLELIGTDNSTYTLTWKVRVYDFSIAWKDISTVVEYTNDLLDCELPLIISAPEGTYKFVVEGVYGNNTYAFTTNNVSKYSVANLTTKVTIPNTYLSGLYGKHLISVKLVNANNLDQDSDPIKIIILNESQQTPAIVLLTDNTTLTQYQSASIRYYIHDQSALTANVNISLTYINETEETLDMPLNQDEERQVGLVHTFTYPFYSPHPNGVKIRITYNKSQLQSLYDEVTLIVQRNEDNIDLSYHNANLVYILDPRGWSNQSSNKSQFAKDGTKTITYSSNFDWINGGFQEDTKSINNTLISEGSAFVIRRGTSITLPRGLFNDDDDKGKTIAISFKIKNCANYDSQILDDVLENKGLKLCANQALLYLNRDKPEKIPYAEENRIDLTINIEPASYKNIVNGTEVTTTNKYRVATVWLDGVPSNAVRYLNAGILSQNKKTVIGSNDCDIYIYSIKIYNTSLDFQQMNQNFIADGTTMDEKLARYNRNVHLYNNNNIVESELIAKRMVTVIHLDITDMTRNKENPQDCDITITEPDGTETIISGAKFKVQGTSSAAYERSSLNLDLDFSACKDQNNNSITYKISENSIPVNYLNIKVNVASSEHANNVCAVDWYNTYQPFHTDAKDTIQGVRDSVEAKPCVVFIRNKNSNKGIYIGSQYVDAETTTFYAAGDLCNSKKNKAVFGQDSPNVQHPTLACMEIGGNSRIPQQLLMNVDTYNFLQLRNDTVYNKYPIQIDKITTKGWYTNTKTNKPYYFYEWRMAPIAKTNANDEIQISVSQIANFWLNAAEWVGNLANGVVLKTRTHQVDGEDVIQYGNADGTVPWNSIDTEQYTYSYDFSVLSYKFMTKQAGETDAQYTARLDTLKEQFSHYFQLESLLYHFLMIEYFAAIDNVSKNTFYSLDFDNTQFDEQGADGKLLPSNDPMHMYGYRWNIKAAYDWDTILGTDNDGKPFTSFGLDYEQTYGDNNSYYFNAGKNPLWHFIRVMFKPELYSLYGNLSSTAFSASKLQEKWDNYQSYRPELVLAQDAYVKYILPYKTEGFVYPGDPDAVIQRSDSDYLARLCGTKKYQRSQFLSYQQLYMNGKYGTTTTTGALNFRTDGSKTLNAYIDPYITTYVTIIKDSQPVFSEKIIKSTKPNIYSVTWPAGSDDTIYVQPAGLIQRIDPISRMQVRSFNASSAGKLLRFDMHESDTTKNTRWGVNTDSTNANVSSPVLNYFNAKNVAPYNETLNFNSKQGGSLRYLNIVGTGCDSVETVPYCPIEKLYLNDCSNLYLRNNSDIQVLSFSPIRAGRKGIRELYMEGCSPAATNTKYVNQNQATDDDETGNDRKNLLEYLQLSLAQTLGSGENRYIYIDNINWTIPNTDLLNQLYEQKGFNYNKTRDPDANCYLAGTVYIHTSDGKGKLYSTDKERFRERWPYLTIIPDKEIQMYTVILKHKETQQILVTQQKQVDERIYKTDLDDWLTTAGYYNYQTHTTKYSDPTYPEDFTDDTPYKVMTGDATTITIMVYYTAKTRYYTVKWYKDSTKSQLLLSRDNVTYGQELDFTVLTGRNDTSTGTFIPGSLPAPEDDSVNNRYLLFDEWDASTGFISDDIDVCGKWISSPKIFNRKSDGSMNIDGVTVPFNKLNAANFYAMTRMSSDNLNRALYGRVPTTENPITTEEQNKLLTSVIDIKLGYDYEYTNIQHESLLDEPINNIESPVTLNKTISLNDPFTLLFQFYSNAAENNNNIFSLNDDDDDENIKTTVMSLRKISNNNDIYRFYYQGTSVSVSDTLSVSTNSNSRFILTNNPLQNKISIYWWDCGETILKDSLTTPKKDFTYPTTLKQRPLKLMLGAEYRTDYKGQLIFKASNVNYYNVKYWNNILGSIECQKLALCPNRICSFVFCGIGLHGIMTQGEYESHVKFSFAQRGFMPNSYNISYNSFFLNLNRSSNYYKKIFPNSWQQLFTPINDYCKRNSSGLSSFIKPSLFIYPPMYSQERGSLYPEYHNNKISGQFDKDAYINQKVNENFPPLTWTGLIVTADGGHSVSSSQILHTGDIVKCSSTACSVIVCESKDLSSLPETTRNKFSAPGTSVNGISSNNANYYFASTSAFNSQIHGQITNSGYVTYALMYLPEATKYSDSNLLYIYQGGGNGYLSDSNNSSYTIRPVCCFSIS